MAKLSQLVNRVSMMTGVEEKTVRQHARYAREAGFISQGGRGPGGADMTVSDAANLLIAVMTATQLSESARTIRQYREMHLAVHPQVRLANWKPDPAIPETLLFLADPGQCGCFGEALDTLIQKAVTLEMQQALFPTPGSLLKRPLLRIEISRPFPDAIIRLEDRGTSEIHPKRLLRAAFTVDYLLLEQQQRFEEADELLHEREEADLRTITSVTQNTVYALGNLLAGREASY